MQKLDNLVTLLVEKGQPLTHIWTSHKDEILLSQRMLHKYIDSGVLSLTYIDLRLKLRYRLRKKKQPDREVRNCERVNDCRYEDYLYYLRMYPGIHPIETDTVKDIQT